jgi:hypothetical protein
MNTINNITLIICIFIISTGFKPVNNSYKNYINQHISIANQLQIECGIPASIQIAQAIAESGGGRSNIAKKSNNHFGIKAYKNWNGKTYNLYSAYDNSIESYVDHAIFLNQYYDHAIGKPADYWINNCNGYGAGNYWIEIGKIIDLYNLKKYDL